MTYQLVAVTAGLGHPSSTRTLVDRIAAATRIRLGYDTEIEIVELRELAHDITSALLTGFAVDELATVIEHIGAADAVIFVTPTFNASYSGLFKSFIDVLPQGLMAHRPTLLAATGGSARHSLTMEYTLRPLFAYLRAAVAPTTVFAAAEDFAGALTDGEDLADRIDRAAGELADLVLRSWHKPDDAREARGETRELAHH